MNAKAKAKVKAIQDAEEKRALRKRINLWFDECNKCICAAKRNIRDGRPLAAIASVNIARLELLKVKQTLLRQTKGRG